MAGTHRQGGPDKSVHFRTRVPLFHGAQVEEEDAEGGGLGDDDDDDDLAAALVRGGGLWLLWERVCACFLCV
jgi:hypothetical protein